MAKEEEVVKCGLIFNRHKWVRIFEGDASYGIPSVGKICSKCGQCQMYYFDMNTRGWVSCIFDALMKKAKEAKAAEIEAKKIELAHIQDTEESRRKALEFLRAKKG